MTSQRKFWRLLPLLTLMALGPWMPGAAGVALADPPHVSYVFPAGGQRGTKVDVRIGGHYMHEKSSFAITGPGIQGPSEVVRMKETIWFEGPLIHQPASQRAEDYPTDYAATFTIAPNAPLGSRPWRVWTSQGITTARRFVVGELPETVEVEVDGEPIPLAVKTPVTINGRIFPREDVDVWTFEAEAGKEITCAVSALAIGSPLDARLELRDARGQLLMEATSAGKSDPILKFTPSTEGKFELRIHDVKFDGLQNYVYRLTITDKPWVDPLEVQALSQAAKQAASSTAVMKEVEPNNGWEKATAAELPLLVAGVIDPPGDMDAWSFEANKGQPITIEVDSAKRGSPLQAVLVIRNAEGVEVLRRDSLMTNSGEVKVTFNPAGDGRFSAEVSERFGARGGKAFEYALRVGAAQPSVRLELPADVISVDRGKTAKLPINVFREGGFNGPVTVSVEGLPGDVTVKEIVLAGNKPKADLVLQAEETAKVSLHTLRVVGKYQFDGVDQTATAVYPASIDEETIDQMRLAVTMPTPFKYQAEFALSFAPCGSVYRKRYVLERGGYEGTLEAKLAERQGRHLQGVTGPTLTVPADADEFVYPITLAPWMELGRTSRVVPMITGIVTDEQGVKHKVCYMTNDQNCQLVSIVSPSPLRVVLDRPSVVAVPKSKVTVNVQVRRDKTINAPVKLELVVPPHIRDVRADVVQVPTGATEASFTVEFGASPGPFNFPLMVRAVGEKDGDPLVAEALFDAVPAP